MTNAIALFLLWIGALAGLFILFGVVWLWRRREVALGRRNPLTRNLLRSPGQSIRDQLDDLQWDVATYLAVAMIPLPFAAAWFFLQWVMAGKPPSAFAVGAVVAFSIGAIGWFAWKLWNALRTIANLRLGYDAELAVGQELNELLRYGYRVFHDFPVEEHKFNIDHVVVGPGGVFAVETKGRSKPSSKDASGASWEVAYDGKTLQFPGWRETDPVRQAEAAARWLKKTLSSAVGDPVEVRPVVVLPGWYVRRTSPGGVPVLASGQIQGFFSGSRASLDGQSIQRIAHQLEQRCRDVAPSAYRSGDEDKN